MSEPTSTVVTLDSAAASVDAVQRALYVFADQLAGRVAVKSTQVEVTLETIGGAPVEPWRVRFEREVLDQVLRARIREETAPVRNAVLAVALSRVSDGFDQG